MVITKDAPVHTLQFSFHSAAEVVRERPAHYCVAAVSVHVQDFLLVGLTWGSSADLGGILNMGECFCELRVEGAVSERPETSPVGHICNLERHLAEKIRI